MRHLSVAIFFLCLVLFSWCVQMAARRRTDPTIAFHLGNVNESGRKYLWMAVFWFLAAMVSFFFD